MDVDEEDVIDVDVVTGAVLVEEAGLEVTELTALCGLEMAVVEVVTLALLETELVVEGAAVDEATEEDEEEDENLASYAAY